MIDYKFKKKMNIAYKKILKENFEYPQWPKEELLDRPYYDEDVLGYILDADDGVNRPIKHIENIFTNNRLFSEIHALDLNPKMIKEAEKQFNIYTDKLRKFYNDWMKLYKEYGINSGSDFGFVWPKDVQDAFGGEEVFPFVLKKDFSGLVKKFNGENLGNAEKRTAERLRSKRNLPQKPPENPDEEHGPQNKYD